MQPGPDFGNKRNQRDGIFELERPFGGFMPEHQHADQSAGPAAERAQHCQGKFWNPAAGTRSPPFIETKREECHHAERGEPDGGK